MDHPTSAPTVSVVMPVRNEVDNIGAALDAVLDQDYDGPLEVIVADGRSTDGTADLVRTRAADDARIHVVDNPAGSAAAGLNVAIAAASGSIIVRCDGHARLGAGYIKTAVATLAETGAANVGGRQDAIGTNPMHRAIAIAMTSPFGVGNSRFHYSDTPGPTDTVYLGVFDRAAVDAVGGYDESLLRNQDYDLNHRLIRAGHTVWFDPRLRVSYTPRSSLAALWSQYRDYGSWKRAMLGKDTSALKARQLAPPLLIVALVASFVLLALGLTGLGLVVPLVYAGFLAVAGLVETIRRRDLAALLLPAVLATMHIAWGSAFLFRPARL